MPVRGINTDQEVHIRVANPGGEETTLVLEPWGETFTMPPRAAFEVVGRGPSTDTIEISVQDGSIVVWGWAGSVLSLFHDETELGDATSRPSVPLSDNVTPTKYTSDRPVGKARR